MNVQPTDAAQYRCATNGQCNITNSNAAILTVNTPPAITHIRRMLLYVQAAVIPFSVAATGTNLTYQWQSAATLWRRIYKYCRRHIIYFECNRSCQPHHIVALYPVPVHRQQHRTVRRLTVVNSVTVINPAIQCYCL